MFISKLSIRNFRNFRNATLNFKKGVNTIIGENGSGKTNLFHAIRLLIDENMPRSVKLYENDFNRSLGKWAGHWIVIQIKFEDLDSSEEAQSIAIHKIGDLASFEKSQGTYCMYFRPRIEIRRNLFKLSENIEKTPERLQEILDKLSLNDYESVFTGRGTVDFANDEIYSEYVGDFENVVFPDPDNERTDVYGIRMYGVSIPNEFACTFAKALRDVESDLRSYKDNPLLNLLRDKEKNIPIEKKHEIESQVDTLNKNISGLDEVKNVSNGITQSIKQTVGETYAPNVNIKSELPLEMEKILQSLKLWVGDPDEEGHEGRLWELSLGGANLIYLSLKLLEFEKIKKENKIANFILIEEPEAHIHNHIQKSLFQKLNREKTQVFISTHSTHISSVCKISTMNILGRGKQKTQVFAPSNNLEQDKVIKLERYLDANRTNLLFAKGVILVEGDAEHILIPIIVKKVFGVSLDELGISIINIGSTGFDNVAQLFHKDRVQRNCSIITDNDISIVELPEEPEADTKYERDCRNSQISGEARKVKLDEYSKSNGFVKSFYARHTFEVDFLIEGNSYEVISAVQKAFTKPETINKIKGLLENKEISFSGKEVLRLAEKFGKGWFAIMVSEHIGHLTNVPNYILDAIAFACPSFNKNVLFEIAKYRLWRLEDYHYEDDTTDYKLLFDQIISMEDRDEALSYFIKELPEDVLTKLIGILDV